MNEKISKEQLEILKTYNINNDIIILRCRLNGILYNQQWYK